MSDQKPQQDEPTWKTTLPFPKRWALYIGVKFAVLALAIWLTLRWYGLA
jgi:hypothetical protein